MIEITIAAQTAEELASKLRNMADVFGGAETPTEQVAEQEEPPTPEDKPAAKKPPTKKAPAAKKPPTKKAPAKKAPAKAKKPEEPVEADPAVAKKDALTILMDLYGEGGTARDKVKALLKKYGVSKFSEIGDAEGAALKKDAEALKEAA